MSDEGQIEILAPAKINLFLKVLRRREDGYHDICSMVQAVDLYDTLRFRKAESGTKITCDNPKLPIDKNNLVWKAVDLISRELGIEEGVEIDLKKRIPVGAGLGGGSSDAASTLKGMNQLFGLGLPNVELMELGARLGSDVAFFLSTGSAMISGRGEKVEPLMLPMTYRVLLVIPDFEVSTAKAYEGLRFSLTTSHARPNFQVALNGAEFLYLLNSIGNDFQAMVERDHPQVSHCMKRLREMGARYVSLSGSGGSFFGLFESNDLAPDNDTTSLSKHPLGWQVCGLNPVAIL